MTTLKPGAAQHVADHARGHASPARGEPAGPGAPPAAFAVRVYPYREAVHLKVVGELDLASVNALQAEHERMLARGFGHVVIDLRELEFIDVAGLRLLLAMAAAARGDGWRLSMIQGPPAVARVFELTGTLHELPFTLPLAPAAVA